MLIFQSHSKNIIQYDMISQFAYKNNYITPELDKIVLNFGIKEVNFKLLLLVMATLEMISTQKPMITNSSLVFILQTTTGVKLWLPLEAYRYQSYKVFIFLSRKNSFFK